MDDLIKQNPHWKGQSVKVPVARRDIFNDVIKDLDKDPMSLISGPRRVGKSVLLKQLMVYFIEQQKISPKQILYYEFSPQSTKEDLEKVFYTFVREICNQEEKTYVFFDELQYVKNYESALKLIYDLNKSHAKIFLTGSLSISYKRKMYESLAGRLLEYKMFPLFFDEFLRLTDDNGYKEYTEGKSKLFEDKLFVSGVAEKLRYKFEQFLKFKRLPEPASYEDEEKCILYNKSVLDQSLSQDAMSYFSVGYPRVFINLFYKVALANGSEISVKSLSEDTFGVGMVALSSYLDIMEIMGLLYVVRNTTDPLKGLNSNKKMYVSSHYSGEETDMGHLVESYVLERFLSQGKVVTYYRNRKNEIDFLIPKEKLAVEVKFTSKFDSNDFKTLNNFCSDRGYSPMVVSLSTTESATSRMVIPAIFL